MNDVKKCDLTKNIHSIIRHFTLFMSTAANTKTAEEIYTFFKAKGWTTNAIAALLGNMQGESGISADVTEKGGGGGYGLVQWTPKTKLTDWATANKLTASEVKTQCMRIQYELDNGEQFYSTKTYPMTFKAFSKSTDTASELAKVFIYNYERPKNKDQPQRSTWATEWYDYFIKLEEKKKKEEEEKKKKAAAAKK